MSKGISDRVEATVTAIEMLVRGRVSRGEIQLATGLSRTFVMDFINALKAANLVHESGRGPDSAGRLKIEQFSFGPKPAQLQSTPVIRTVWSKAISKDVLASIGKSRAAPRRKPLVSIPKAISEITSSE